MLKWYSPAVFYRRTGSLLLPLKMATLMLFAVGLWMGLVVAPADYQQGDAFRIIYLHVPTAFLSIGLYTFAASMALVSVIWRVKVADVLIESTLPFGAVMTALALMTGSIWGKPMWGTWWIWDARLTSELILLFIYLGLIALQHSLPASPSKSRVMALMVLVGFVDLPIIHYSVEWWNTLHQGASLSLLSKPTIAGTMLYPLLILLVAFSTYSAWLILASARGRLLVQEKRQHWVQQLVQGQRS